MRKLLVSLISILMVLTLAMPISAQDQTVTAADLNGGAKTGDIIIMGEYEGEPIEWRVLVIDDSSTRLISEYILFKSEFGGSNNYESSVIRTYLTRDFLKNFTIEELSYVEKTTYSTNIEDGSNYELTDEFFLLSAYEVGLKSSANNEGSNIGFGSDADRIAYLLDSNSDTGDYWWLRTAYYSSHVRLVYSDGSLGIRYPSFSYGVRPACHIKSNTPIYTWSDGSYHLVEESVPLENIELNHTTSTLTAGDTLELNVTFTPEDADDKSVTWSSTDETVATVDQNGIVTAMSPGTTTITVTSNTDPSIKATCEITVTAKITPSDPGDNKPSRPTKPSSESKPEKVYDPYDTNKDGVVTCEEKFGSGWIWSEDQKACIRQEWIIVDTSTK